MGKLEDQFRGFVYSRNLILRDKREFNVLAQYDAYTDQDRNRATSNDVTDYNTCAFITCMTGQKVLKMPVILHSKEAYVRPFHRELHDQINDATDHFVSAHRAQRDHRSLVGAHLRCWALYLKKMESFFFFRNCSSPIELEN